MNEKTLVLERKLRLSDRTLGVLKINGVYYCNTLEPTYRDYANGEKKVTGKSCIPAGTYRIELRKSNKFKEYRAFLLNVPMFEGVLIHEGNTPKDTAGCILLGILDKKRPILLNSKIMIRSFVSSMKYFGYNTITIEDSFNEGNPIEDML